MKTYHGFNSANSSRESAWFHTPEAALQFAQACGWRNEFNEPLSRFDLKMSGNPDPADILDTPEKPWSKE